MIMLKLKNQIKAYNYYSYFIFKYKAIMRYMYMQYILQIHLYIYNCMYMYTIVCTCIQLYVWYNCMYISTYIIHKSFLLFFAFCFILKPHSVVLISYSCILSLMDYSWQGLFFIWDTGDQIQVGYIEDKHPTLNSIFQS